MICKGGANHQWGGANYRWGGANTPPPPKETLAGTILLGDAHQCWTLQQVYSSWMILTMANQQDTPETRTTFKSSYYKNLYLQFFIVGKICLKIFMLPFKYEIFQESNFPELWWHSTSVCSKEFLLFTREFLSLCTVVVLIDISRVKLIILICLSPQWVRCTILSRCIDVWKYMQVVVVNN